MADLFAVVLFHFSTGHTADTTVTTVIRTAFIVVLVVAVAVSLVFKQPARNRWLAEVLRIDALALHKHAHSTCIHTRLCKLMNAHSNTIRNGSVM